MPGVVVFGSQWGDEGKGRFVDNLACQADMVIRYQGGNNAGHTVCVGGVTYKLHTVPSGILFPGKPCVIGNGVVIDPASLLEEIAEIESHGVNTDGLYISDRAHLIMPYHRVIDALGEAKLGAAKIGTTCKGIGPCYTDKTARRGFRMCDLLEFGLFAQKLKTELADRNELITKVYGAEPLSYEEMVLEFLGYAEKLAPRICDTSLMINEAMSAGKKLLFEGAQGALLDIDFGTYPYVTSSHPTTAGVFAGAGVGPKAVSEVLGVVKAYTTRVGEGPFLTELLDEKGEEIRQKGHEFGTTTGRPRRTGWLDLVILRFAARIGGITAFALSRMDTLGGVGPVKVCTGYEYEGAVIDNYPASLAKLSKMKPIYTELPGWRDDISQIREFDALPEEAKSYVRFIEEQTGIPVAMIGVGAGREECIIRKSLF